jgi:hypothetical protein
MSSESTRLISSLHWFVDEEFVDEENRPLALDLRGAKVFCFFGSRLNAKPSNVSWTHPATGYLSAANRQIT